MPPGCTTGSVGTTFAANQSIRVGSPGTGEPSVGLLTAGECRAMNPSGGPQETKPRLWRFVSDFSLPAAALRLASFRVSPGVAGQNCLLTKTPRLGGEQERLDCQRR